MRQKQRNRMSQNLLKATIDLICGEKCHTVLDSLGPIACENVADFRNSPNSRAGMHSKTCRYRQKVNLTQSPPTGIRILSLIPNLVTSNLVAPQVTWQNTKKRLF